MPNDKHNNCKFEDQDKVECQQSYTIRKRKKKRFYTQSFKFH